MTRLAVRLTAAVLAAVFLWLLATLPPRPAPAAGDVPERARGHVARTVNGAFHVHSTNSDGTGDRSAIAAAAARAGLRFVVMTDHGDGTRRPDPPAYIGDVLCIDAVEISTNGGHLIALDMPAAPYPLGGEPSAVVEDVRRLGGFPVVSHPHSPKASLAWRAWNLPIGGLEWLNLDSEWRDEPALRLARAAAVFLLRPAPALASLLDRPAPTLARWDALSAAGQRIVGLAGHDAHGGLARGPDEAGQRAVPGLSSYEASFKTFSLRAVLDEAWTGDATQDARRLLAALRDGRVFTVVDAVAGPAWADYRASVGKGEHGMGAAAAMEEGAELMFSSPLPPQAVAVLLRDGGEVARSGSGELRFRATQSGAYRVEVRTPAASVPWIVTNPIYLGLENESLQPLGPGASLRAGTAMLALADGGVVEKDPRSDADLVSDGSRRRLTYRLAGEARASQYVAIAVALRQAPAFDHVVFTGRSEAPMRVSVQLRFENPAGARWVHSVYLSPEAREIVVPVEQLRPADAPQRRPPAESASSVLFVVDLTNASPGSRGWFEVSALTLAARQ
jgi:hypothetical protein